jgi:hypothetical protein
VTVTSAPAWERLPGEPAKAYAAFRVYRDLPPSTRTVESVVGTADVTQKGRQLRYLAVQWDWRERAQAWDDECARVEDGERLEQIRDMHRTHRRAGRAVTLKAMQALQLMQPEDLPPAAAVRLLEIGTRLERLTLSQSVAELQGLDDVAGEDPWDRVARALDPNASVDVLA